MKKLYPLLLLVLFTHVAAAQLDSFNLEKVPEQLKKNAAVITYLDDSYFEVTDIDRAYLTVHRIFTVLNESGKEALNFSEYSNKFLELKDAEIRVYDAQGKKTDKYKMRDMNTVANGEGLIDDGKVTYLHIAALKYPVTVEVTYELKYKGTLFYPDYTIQQGADQAVLNSSFTAKVPLELDLRYKESNIQLKPEITSAEKYKTYKWSLKNVAALEYEKGTVSYANKYPKILLAPNHFKIYDTEGDMTTWKNFGLWEAGLINKLDKLPEERISFFKELVKNASSETEKIRLVYSYLQKNFRYVSIQLGIGGYQPFPASFTDQKKYGDCKGLSFYTHAVLSSLGITSHIALVNAGYNETPVDPSFPCNEFDHMILCVPQKKDTIWLECTSKTNDFGVLGSFTENRNALLITAEGGHLVATPSSKAHDNIISSSMAIKLAEDGSGSAVFTPTVKGAFKQSFMHELLEEKKDEQKEFLIDVIGIKQPDEFTVNHSENGDVFTTSIDLIFEKIPAFTAGSKMFLSPRMYKLWNIKMPPAENRRLDYYFNYPFEKSDTTIYKLPEGFGIDLLPAPKKIECDFGYYSTQYWYDEKEFSVYSVVTLVLSKYRIPAMAYTKMKTFFDDVTKDETQRIVIRKK